MLDDQLLPALAKAGRHQWKPSTNRGRISINQAKGPSASSREGRRRAMTRWSLGMCKNGRVQSLLGLSGRCWLSELEASLSTMMRR